MRRPELGLEVGEEREHRRLDLRFVLLAVRLEVSLVVVRAQAEEETLEVALPTRERSWHARRLELISAQRRHRTT